METENKGLIDVRDCPCDGCQAKPCGHPARCVKFTLWLNKTADAVEVVRCKDCKYAMDMMPIENSGGCLMGECTLRKEDDVVFTAWGDEFCSYGERKDNG